MEVISDLNVGGAQEVVRTLVENLAEVGCVPVLCTFQDGPLRREIEGLGILVEVLPERRSSVMALPRFLAEMWRIRQALVALVEQYEIDIVQTHLLRSLDFLVLSLRLNRRLQIYWTFHNAQFDLREEHLQQHKWLLRPKRFAHHLLYRWGGRWVNGLIAVSEDVKTSLLKTIPGISAEKIAVIDNGVDVRRYRQVVDRAAVRQSLGLDEGDQVAAVVATFKRQKGHCYLIEAAAAVVEQFPNLHILLIGDGELHPELKAQTEALGLERHIHFLGTRHDVPELLATSDFFVLPSLWEGLSMALVEAMASGLPVIATEVSGTNQVMAAGETGWLVPPGDSQRLAEAMVELLADPARAQMMAAAASQRVERYFSAQKQAKDHIALFSQPGNIAHAKAQRSPSFSLRS